MTRRTRRIVGFLFIVLATLLSIEGMLLIADPVGLVYFSDMGTFHAAAMHSEEIYRLPPREHTLTGWSFTINEDGTRHVPNAGDGAEIIFIGDSQTFSWGVNDADTWVNLVSQELDIKGVNTGLPGYNATQVLATVNRYPDAERLVFLTLSNDEEGPVRQQGGGYYSRLSSLLLWLSRTPSTERDPQYHQSMQSLADDPRVLILAFDNSSYSDMAARDYGAVLIPTFTKRISLADAHANVEGNREIADGVLPVLTKWLSDSK